MAGIALLALAIAACLPGAALVAAPVEPPFETLRGPPLIAECGAAPPLVGQRFGGTVLQVVDGQTLCVAVGPTPVDWIRVKIAGVPADTGRGTLLAAAFGQSVECLAVKAVPLGVEARCWRRGAALDHLVSTDASRQEGLDWR